MTHQPTITGVICVSAFMAVLLLTLGASASGVTGPADKAARQPEAVTADTLA